MLDKVKHAHFSQAHTYIYAFIHPHILMKFAPFFTQQEKNIYFTYDVNLTTTQ
jgi:hypothetical protein